MSVANERVKAIRALQARRKARLRAGQFVVEGVRLVEEAVRSGAVPLLALYSERESEADPRLRAVVEQLRSVGTESLPATDEVIARCADTETAQGIVAIAALPNVRAPASPTLQLVLDQVRDPGNLGAILRTALAAGVEQVWLSPGTVDPTNPKVVRSAMGAHFWLPIRAAGWPEIAAGLAGSGVWLSAAGADHTLWEVDWRSSVALIVGGEAEGAGQEAAALATGRVSIPMPGGAESLNAALAAGILLFEVVRQRSSTLAPRQ